MINSENNISHYSLVAHTNTYRGNKNIWNHVHQQYCIN